jgi:hypothetical protein
MHLAGAGRDFAVWPQQRLVRFSVRWPSLQHLSVDICAFLASQITSACVVRVACCSLGWQESHVRYFSAPIFGGPAEVPLSHPHNTVSYHFVLLPRYYRALYAAMDREGPTTSSRAPMFLSLLFKAMQAGDDVDGDGDGEWLSHP